MCKRLTSCVLLVRAQGQKGMSVIGRPSKSLTAPGRSQLERTGQLIAHIAGPCRPGTVQRGSRSKTPSSPPKYTLNYGSESKALMWRDIGAEFAKAEFPVQNALRFSSMSRHLLAGHVAHQIEEQGSRAKLEWLVTKRRVPSGLCIDNDIMVVCILHPTMPNTSSAVLCLKFRHTQAPLQQE